MDMTIGPVQLIALGFDKPDFQGEMIEEFERLRESDTVRVIDALVVYKDAEGDVTIAKGSQLTKDEAEESAPWSARSSASVRAARRAWRSVRPRAPRRRPAASTCLTRRRRGTSSRSFRTTPPPR